MADIIQEFPLPRRHNFSAVSKIHDFLDWTPHRLSASLKLYERRGWLESQRHIEELREKKGIADAEEFAGFGGGDAGVGG